MPKQRDQRVNPVAGDVVANRLNEHFYVLKVEGDVVTHQCRIGEFDESSLDEWRANAVHDTVVTRGLG